MISSLKNSDSSKRPLSIGDGSFFYLNCTHNLKINKNEKFNNRIINALLFYSFCTSR